MSRTGNLRSMLSDPTLLVEQAYIGGVWCDLGVLWLLYKIHGFRQGILCFGDLVIFEWVGTLGQGGPIKFVTFVFFLYVLHRVFPIRENRPKIGSKLILFNFVTIHPISR